MKIECKKTYRMDYSYLDKNLNLRINECFNLAQNNSTEYFKRFNGDNISVRNNDNAVWVASKIKIHIFKKVKWLENIIGESFTSLIKPIRIETETKFTNQNGEIVFIANQQSCPLDFETRKIRKVNTVTFPKDMEVENTLFDSDYQKLNDMFDENDFVSEQRVQSQDIDFSNHVNNTIYVRYIMDSLPSEFLDKINITDVEMHYISESKEGQVLKIYRKDIENDIIRFLIKENEREVVRASIKYMR